MSNTDISQIVNHMNLICSGGRLLLGVKSMDDTGAYGWAAGVDFDAETLPEAVEKLRNLTRTLEQQYLKEVA